MDILDEQEPKPNFLICLEVIKFYVLATRRIGFPFPRAFNDLIESGITLFTTMVDTDIICVSLIDTLDDEGPGTEIIVPWPNPIDP